MKVLPLHIFCSSARSATIKACFPSPFWPSPCITEFHDMMSLTDISSNTCSRSIVAPLLLYMLIRELQMKTLPW
jgi:hypothetical protein